MSKEQKIGSDSTQSFRGIVFQFLIALEQCFKMEEGQSVYIETYGDVSLVGEPSVSKQIESKLYQHSLTNYDSNIWKTMYNWMDSTFSFEKFSSLVLLTTQKISISSIWLNWNSKNFNERLQILENAKTKYARKKKKSQDIQRYMERIFDEKNRNKLIHIAKALYFDCLDTDEQAFYKHLQDTYGKNIPFIQKAEFINCLYGFIISPNIIKKQWEITYDRFSKEVEDLTQRLVDTTTEFPSKLHLAEINQDDYKQSKFVEKINDIDYDEVINEAIGDYLQAATMIQKDLWASETKKKSLNQYEENIISNYNAQYRMAARNFKDEERISKSKDLYDKVTHHNDGTFSNYISIPNFFHAGMVQILADEGDDIVWLLKRRDHE